MLHRVYDLCAAHCSPRDADSGHIVAYIVIILSLPSTLRCLNEQKLSTFSESVPYSSINRALARIYINIASALQTPGVVLSFK